MLSSFLRWLGFGLCHQLPERSFFGGGIQAPVCARDTGIYVGFVISFVVILVLHRGERPSKFPRLWAWAFFGACVAFMGWDGITSYAGLRPSTNLLRLVTGMGTGFSAAALIVPMLNDVLWNVPGHGRLFEPPLRFVLWVGSLFASTVFLWFVGPAVGVLYPLGIAASILATLTLINLVIVGMLPAFDRRATAMASLVLPTTIALLLAFVEVWAASGLRAVLTSLGG